MRTGFARVGLPMVQVVSSGPGATRAWIPFCCSIATASSAEGRSAGPSTATSDTGDVHIAGGETGRAVRIWVAPDRRLGVPGAVGGTHDELHRPRSGRRPRVCPAPPRERTHGRLERRLAPRLRAVGRELDL